MSGLSIGKKKSENDVILMQILTGVYVQIKECIPSNHVHYILLFIVSRRTVIGPPPIKQRGLCLYVLTHR